MLVNPDIKLTGSTSSGVLGVNIPTLAHGLLNQIIVNPATSTTGISNFTDDSSLFYNNIISSCTTGVDYTNEITSNIWDYNNWHGNVTDTVKVTKGTHDIALDPQFTDAPNGNFTVGANMKAAGWPGTFPGLSATVGYTDIGAVQRAEPAGGGGGGGAGFFMMGQ